MRLAAAPPAAASAPAFELRPGSSQLAAVAPLDKIEFAVAPRQLPPIAELSARAEGGVQPPPEAALSAARAAAAAAGSGLAGYLAARAALLEALPASVDVAFKGVEGGRPTAVLRPVPQGEQSRAGAELGRQRKLVPRAARAISCATFKPGPASVPIPA